jgi:hypothetical protein
MEDTATTGSVVTSNAQKRELAKQYLLMVNWVGLELGIGRMLNLKLRFPSYVLWNRL